MRPLPVIVSKPSSQAFSQIEAVFKRMKMKIVILHRPPEPLDKDVVHASAAAIHADFKLAITGGAFFPGVSG